MSAGSSDRCYRGHSEGKLGTGGEAGNIKEDGKMTNKLKSQKTKERKNKFRFLRFSVFIFLGLSWILSFGFGIFDNVHAAFHDYGTPAGQRTLSYFLMQQLSYSYPSSAINFDLGADANRSFEFSLLGYRSAYILTNSSYQVGLVGKQKIADLGNLSFTGVAGVGALYQPTLGTSICGNFGGILGLDILSGLKISSPIIASIFSDGVLVDYSAGVSFKPVFLGGKEIILGGKGVAMVISSGGTFTGFQNSLYAMLGLRTTL